MAVASLVLDPGATPMRGADAVERAALREEEFTPFYNRTVRPLRAYLARSCGDLDLADELVQEAYYRFLGSGFRGESEAHRRNYLYRIATNLLRDHYRRARWRWVPLEEATAEEPPRCDADLRKDLRRPFAELKPRQRQLLWLAHVEGLSHREIAEVMRLREGSIRLLLFRARRRLAALLRERGLGPEVLTR